MLNSTKKCRGNKRIKKIVYLERSLHGSLAKRQVTSTQMGVTLLFLFGFHRC